MNSIFSAPTNVYLLLDGFNKVSYAYMNGFRRNIFPQFAGVDMASGKHMH